MYLTVPLPIIQTRVFKLSFVPRDPLQAPMKVKLLIPQNASFQKIKERIGSLLKVNASHVSSPLVNALTSACFVRSMAWQHLLVVLRLGSQFRVQRERRRRLLRSRRTHHYEQTSCRYGRHRWISHCARIHLQGPRFP
jgi:hypothetical protein